MSGVQLTYEEFTRNAVPGQVADIGPYEIASRTNRTPASAVIPFGMAVGFDPTPEDNGCVLGLGAGFIGISVRRTAKENSTVGAESEEYTANQTVGILRSGKIWAVIVNGGAQGATIFFNDTTGAISSGIAGAGETQIVNAILDMSVLPLEVGLIRIGA